jgi:thiamine kinase-like enzyme
LHSGKGKNILEKGILIGAGRTAEIFEYGDGKVLKLFRKEFPREPAEWEFKVSQAAAERFLKAPKVYNSIVSEDQFGIVFEKLEGRSSLKEMLRKPWKNAGLARLLADLQQEIHQITVKNLPLQKSEIEKKIAGSRDLSDAQKKKIINYLYELPDGDKLCHGDLHPDNVFLSQRGPVVIDWMTANSGNPACDVARSFILCGSNVLPHHLSFPLKVVIRIFRKNFFRAYKKQILKLSGMQEAEVESWILPLAAARLIEWNEPDEQKYLLELINRKLAELEQKEHGQPL